MKIQFLDGDGYELKNSEIYVKFGKKLFNEIKKIEIDKNVVKKIMEFRKKFNIPQEGYSLKEIDSMPIKKYNKLFLKVKRLIKNINVNQLILSYMEGIILTEAAYNFSDNLIGGFNSNSIISWKQIFFDKDEKHIFTSSTNPKRVEIYIRGKISKEELINFIKNHWSQFWGMEDTINHLPRLDKAYISKRDKEIIFLRDEKKMTFPQIAKYLDNFYTDSTVKTAYQRAKKKLSIK